MGKILSAKYQVYKDIEGKYRFRLRAANNKILAVSEAYESKAGCINGVKSVQKNCQSEIEDKTVDCKQLPNPKYELFVDKALKFRFNLIASNGQVIASSEAYNSKQGCMRGIEAVKNSCGAVIEDLTVGQVAEKVEKAVTGVVDTGIAMLSPPNVVDSGSTVTFEGWLMDSKTGKGIEKAAIDIWERDRSFMRDKVLTSGITAKDGSFSINWNAKQQDWWDDTVELYAKFQGTENYKPARSANYQIKVLWYAKQKVKVKA
jgi:uncharacterized protein YegP (UPF0339 family)